MTSVAPGARSCGVVREDAPVTPEGRPEKDTLGRVEIVGLESK
jgi:hypothetical protein